MQVSPSADSPGPWPAPRAEPKTKETGVPGGSPGDLSRAGRDSAGRQRFDRRQRPTPRFSAFALLGGRRRQARRSTERSGSFVDLYSRRLWALLLWVAAMNLADSYFTLVHLQAGGVELNPVADALLRTGRIGFVLSKSVLIGVALVVLCVHKNFLMARLGLFLSAAIYTALVAYHLSLFQRT
jgi:Domain of unknown function (DUF5658)